MDLESEVTTCLTPSQIDGHATTVVYQGKWTKKKDHWYFHLDAPIFQIDMSAAGGFPLIYKVDRITRSDFVVGWNSDDIALYTPTKDAIRSVTELNI